MRTEVHVNGVTVSSVGFCVDGSGVNVYADCMTAWADLQSLIGHEADIELWEDGKLARKARAKVVWVGQEFPVA